MFKIDPEIEKVSGVHGKTFSEVVKGRLNTDDTVIKKNVSKNIRRQLPQFAMQVPHEGKIMILCGGPSLNGQLKSIRAKLAKGWKCLTVNGVYNWCLERNIEPNGQVVMDARPYNKKFVEPLLEDCTYLLCSQCDPKVFDKVKESSRVYLWHGNGEVIHRIADRYYNSRAIQVPGGTSVGTRAIFIAVMLGYRTISVYGLDSSYADKKHHAYTQEINDLKHVYKVRCARKTFLSDGWMLKQLDEFMEMCQYLPKELEAEFRGDGLIQTVVNETARRGKPPKISIVDSEEM